MLLPNDEYLTTGSHIGTKVKTGDMERYVYKIRSDGLTVMNIEDIDKRIEIAAKFIARFPMDKVVVVSERLYGFKAADMFAKLLGAKSKKGRFVPGTFTNLTAKHFFEPKLVIVVDPNVDKQAIKEAKKTKAVVIALCSTDAKLRNVDYVIPINNKGKKSVALAFYLLTREIMKTRGDISKDEEFPYKIDDFEYQITEKDNQRMKRLALIKRMNRRKKGKKIKVKALS
jgi:small subunit ribosomal protein S2